MLLILSCLWYVFLVLALLIGQVNEANLCIANALLFILCIYSVSNTHRSVIKPFSCSSQLSVKFQLVIKTEILTEEDIVVLIMLINVKMPTIVGL